MVLNSNLRYLKGDQLVEAQDIGILKLVGFDECSRQIVHGIHR